MPTAIFQDTYAGATEMTVKATKTTRRGVRMTVYSWVPVSAGSCITPGFRPFASIERAVIAAKCHARFSGVRA